jgi:hypothetical protein
LCPLEIAVTWLLIFALLPTKVVVIGPQSACPEDFDLVGVWDLRSTSAPSRLVIREAGEGYIRDQVEAMPFTYKFDLSKDPLWFDLEFEDTTMVRWETLLRCEASRDGAELKWVLRPADGIRPVWPRDDSAALPGVSVIRLWRVEPADSVP